MDLSQHDAFYVGRLFDPNQTYTPTTEKGWAGGTSLATSSGGGGGNVDLSNVEAKIDESNALSLQNRNLLSSIDLDLDITNTHQENILNSLSGIDIKIQDLTLVDQPVIVEEFLFSELPKSFNGVDVRSIRVENFDTTNHLKINDVGVEPLKSVEITNERNYINGTITIQAVDPVENGETFVYENAPALAPATVASSTSIVRVTVIANSFSD